VSLGKFQLLTHGTTVHGAEHRQPERWRIPLTYYSQAGPLGQFFETFAESKQRTVAVIGLGAGSIACYRTSDDTPLTFYKIDPAVVRIAANPNLFQLIAQCGHGVNVILGDGRRQIRKAEEAQYDLLILDAFSSDSVPTHLLIREAFETYFSKLSKQGVLLAHISNQHLDLESVVSTLISDAGLVGRVQHYRPPDASGPCDWRSSWAVLARDEGDLRSWHTTRVGEPC
jgi:spermidine synthase